MNRRYIWDVECSAINAVLWTSFTWEEVEGIAKQIGFSLSSEDLKAESKISAIMDAAQRACHTRNPLSEYIQKLLNETHDDIISLVSTMEPENIYDWCSLEPENLPFTLAGFIWAIVSDERPEMRDVEDDLIWRLYTQGLRALAFGKVELIEV